MKKCAALASLLLLVACSGSDIPSKSPYKGQSSESFSMQLKTYRTIDGDKKLHWFQDYVSGYHEPDPGHVPAALQALNTSSSCSLPKPQADSRLVQVITSSSKRYTSLYVIDDEEFERITENFMAVLGVNRNPALALSKKEGRLQPIDVAVTESAGPVYLVLASTGPVLWNVMAADNARIAGITIISQSRRVAIANAPVTVPVHTLAGEDAERCGAIPALKPVKSYPNIKMQLHRANDNDGKYAEKLAKYADYNNYFKQQFRVESDDVAIGVSVMDHAAIGPVPAHPDARVVFRTLEGSTIKVTPATFIFYGPENKYIAAKKAAVIRRATEITGDDYRAVLEQAGF